MVWKGTAEESLDYAESIINTVREPLIVLDQDLRMVTASRSFYEFFKVTPEETMGQLIYDMGNKQWDIPELRELLETILPEKAFFDDYEVEHDFASIGRRTMLLNARQIGRALRKQRLILLAIEDITERKDLERKLLKARDAAEAASRKPLNEALKETMADLERSNKDLEQFAYVASHDLQEPLRMIASYTQLIARRYKDKLDADANEFIGFAVDGARRMQKMIDDLLSYSRVGTRREPFETVDWTAVLNQVVTNLKLAIEETGAVITHDSLPMVRGDDSQLILLLQNLIGNAIKFRGEEAPRIHISATHGSRVTRDEGRGTIDPLQTARLSAPKAQLSELNGSWVFTVKDNGLGIDPQHKERIFLAFTRLHGREEYPGNGIGLALCKKIVEYHRGRIWVESEPGKGSIFYFTLPETGVLKG